jgi:hypothetical protein
VSARRGCTVEKPQDTWEPYYLPEDFSQARNIGADHPDKLAEVKELFWQEAQKYQVLSPLARFSVFFRILPPLPTITKADALRRRAECLVRHDPQGLRPLLGDHQAYTGISLFPLHRRRGENVISPCVQPKRNTTRRRTRSTTWPPHTGSACNQLRLLPSS